MIRVLDEKTIDKIAAGEVIERPSSVVKELLENAVDAGASAVSVEIKNGGIDLIRVTDNGGGIEREDVRTAFLPHATSKLNVIEDLYTLSSLGFRGEALSSIAAVSEVELLTKTASEITGTRYVIDGGVEKSIDEVGVPDGTTFIVRNLFSHTPARRKFLKSAMTEAVYVTSLVEEIALSRPDISFKLTVNSSLKLMTQGNGDLKEAIYRIYGRDIAEALLPISSEKSGMSITGYIAKPAAARNNRSMENYFVNGRYVKDRLIAKAIEDGYAGYLMQHKFPFVTFSINVQPELLDVNVHPRKMEVKFSESAEVYEFIRQSVRDTLSKREFVNAIKLSRNADRGGSAPLSPEKAPEPFEKARIERLKGDSSNLSGKSGAILHSSSDSGDIQPFGDDGKLKPSGDGGDLHPSIDGGDFHPSIDGGGDGLKPDGIGGGSALQPYGIGGDDGLNPCGTDGGDSLKSFGSVGGNILERGRSRGEAFYEATVQYGGSEALTLYTLGTDTLRTDTHGVNTHEADTHESPVDNRQNIQNGDLLKDSVGCGGGTYESSLGIRQNTQNGDLLTDSAGCGRGTYESSLGIRQNTQNGNLLTDSVGCGRGTYESSVDIRQNTQGENLSADSAGLGRDTRSQDIKNSETQTLPSPSQLDFFGERLLSKEAASEYRIVGQIFQTYWIVEYRNTMLLIDQHAAHEKVKYEHFMEQFENRAVIRQLLSPPIIITLNGEQRLTLEKCLPQFEEMGFEIEPFGGNEYAIRAVPEDLLGLTEMEVLTSLLDELHDGYKNKDISAIHDRIATMACKAAVKGNMNLSFREAEELIKDLLKLKEPYNCPHGRPTMIKMTKTEVEREFKR